MESYLRLKICSDLLCEAGAEVKNKDLEECAILFGLPETWCPTITFASLEEKFTSIEIRKALTIEYDR